MRGAPCSVARRPAHQAFELATLLTVVAGREIEMRWIRLAEDIAEVRRRIEGAVSGMTLDQHQSNAFDFIGRRLLEMERECRSGQLKEPHKRYPELGRIAVETDTAILPADLGGLMIDVEKRYQKA